jgi:hypothetical protein
MGPHTHTHARAYVESFDSWQAKQDFLFSEMFTQSVSLTKVPTQWVPGDPFPPVKAAGAWSWPHFHVPLKFRKSGICCYGMHTDKFRCTLSQMKVKVALLLYSNTPRRGRYETVLYSNRGKLLHIDKAHRARVLRNVDICVQWLCSISGIP